MTLASKRHLFMLPNVSKVLVVEKLTTLQIYQEQADEQSLAAVYASDPAYAAVLPAHKEHRAATTKVCRELRRRGIDFELVRVDKLPDAQVGDHDLTIVVGGDGSVLRAAHYDRGRPLLAVNSDTSTSHGHFCVATASSFGDVLDSVLSGERKPLSLLRLKAFLNGTPLPKLALNEVFVEDISNTSHYTLLLNGQSEEQRSDGVFFASAAGSTGWARSYGVKLMPLLNRDFQYLVRGLIVNPGKTFRFTTGVLGSADSVSVVSQMREGKIAIDGRSHRYEFPRGSRLTVRPSRRFLKIFANANASAPYAAIASPCKEPVGTWH